MIDLSKVNPNDIKFHHCSNNTSASEVYKRCVFHEETFGCLSYGIGPIKQKTISLLNKRCSLDWGYFYLDGNAPKVKKKISDII